MPTSMLYSQSFIYLLGLLPLPTVHLNFASSKLYFSALIAYFFLAYFHFASSKLYFFTLVAYFAPCLPLFNIREASFLYFIFSLCSHPIFNLHPQHFIYLLRVLTLLPAYFYFVFAKLHFFGSFALFAPYPLPFCILKVSLLCFICSFCSSSTSILHFQSFISLLHLFPLLHIHLHFASSKLHMSSSFALCPPSFCIHKTSFL
jgi:hypothetical protein